jgi:hypothetical protein
MFCTKMKLSHVRYGLVMKKCLCPKCDGAGGRIFPSLGSWCPPHHWEECPNGCTPIPNRRDPAPNPCSP